MRFNMETFYGRLNKHGNWVINDFHGASNVYHYYNCLGENWTKFHTGQDASWFGVWFNSNTRQIFTFVEGDEITVTALNDRQFHIEWCSMVNFYRNGG